MLISDQSKTSYFIPKTHLSIKSNYASISCKFWSLHQLWVLLSHHSDHCFHVLPSDAVMSLVWSTIIIQRRSAGNRAMEWRRQEEGGGSKRKSAGDMFRRLVWAESNLNGCCYQLFTDDSSDKSCNLNEIHYVKYLQNKPELIWILLVKLVFISFICRWVIHTFFMDFITEQACRSEVQTKMVVITGEILNCHY